MKIALVGASGAIGSKIAAEALSRGHSVTSAALIDTPQFPAAYKPEASAGRDFLIALRAAGDLDWTFLSPSALIAPGERTGKFRLGTDALLVATDGKSSISIEDFAVALVDELETPRHARRRFTVGY